MATFVVFGPALLTVILVLGQLIYGVVWREKVLFETRVRDVAGAFGLIGMYAYTFGGILFLASGIAVSVGSAVRGLPLSWLQGAVAALLVVGVAWISAMILNPDRFSPTALVSYRALIFMLVATFAVCAAICTRLTQRWQ